MAGQEKAPKKRKLAQDVVAKQEEILHERPYDSQAYLRLLEEYRAADRVQELCETYERMLAVFPRSGEVYTKYAADLATNGEVKRLEKLFARALPTVPYVPLWQAYVNHVQQANAGNPDGAPTISQAYEYTLSRVQHDMQSGQIWAQYIAFLDSWPAASTWEKQHKMDEMRKAYRRVVSLPVANIEPLWRAYNAFENQVGRATARKFVEERSAAYMHARTVVRELTNFGKALDISTVPAPRKFDSAEQERLAAWRRILAFEKTNPLSADTETVQARVLYTFRQALMSMQYFSDLWFEYANYCIQIGQQSDALDSLRQGLEAIPLSFFLTARLAELCEASEDTEGVEAAFRGLIARHQAQAAIDSLAVTVAYAELLRATQRLQGLEAARAVARECRQLPYATFHIYTALAELERQAGNLPIAVQIYQVAYAKFRDAPQFVRSYLDFLFATNDPRNAEVVFEKAAVDFSPAQLRALFELYVGQQARYGDIAKLAQLEARYCETYPDADAVELYARRFRYAGADPVGEELHLKAAMPTAHELIPVPASIVELASRLPPEEDYDGPEIDMSKLIELIVEYA